MKDAKDKLLKSFISVIDAWFCMKKQAYEHYEAAAQYEPNLGDTSNEVDSRNILLQTRII